MIVSSVVSLETVLERHEREQGEIAEDMVRLARSMRHTSLAAQDIMRKDKEVYIHVWLAMN